MQGARLNFYAASVLAPCENILCNSCGIHQSLFHAHWSFLLRIKYYYFVHLFIPDVAKWVLNKCALEEVDDSGIEDFIDYDSKTNEGKLQLQGHNATWIIN